ncbi:MAG TPA: SpoVR family protein, partial [Humisphaera sp.]
MPTHTLNPFPDELLAAKKQIRERARAYGLDFFPVVFEMCDYEQMNQIAAYGGFPQRYPHWRFGMEYERLRKQHHYGLGRIYEMVINNDPCYAYLQESNALVDQKLVIAHVYGHCDFFKNNLWFAHTNRKMMDEMANHSTHVRKHIEKHGLDAVERWLDVCMSVEHLIDPHSAYMQRGPTDVPPPREDANPQREAVQTRFKAKDYMDRWINPPEALAAEARRQRAESAKARHVTPARPTRDVLQYLLEHARLTDWQADCLGIVREESYYFAPQGMTKVMNEGWACLRAESLVFTDRGVITMRSLVDDAAGSDVFDGEARRRVYDRNVIRDHSVVDVVTRRGLRLGGSNNHRVMLADGSWRRLDELKFGDRVRVSGGGGLWAREPVRVAWEQPRRVGLADVAATAGTSVWTVLRHRAGKRVRNAAAVVAALQAYERPENLARPASQVKRRAVRLPRTVNESLGSFLGYLVGDGHVSRVKRTIGLTTGDAEQAVAFASLADELFGLRCRIRRDGNKLRVSLSSEALSEFLTEGLGLTHGVSARAKRVPDAVLRSPEPVVRAFLRAYFDCDAYAGKQGFILSTASDALAEQTQLLLLNYGILSRRRRQKDGCWHVHVTGPSARVLASKVGFGLNRKQRAIEVYAGGLPDQREPEWVDEVTELRHDRADVYDISVEETHRYAAGGFVNHNSYWHSTLMTKHFVEAKEVIDYADHHSGTVHMPPGGFNPYKIGIELFRDIEDRWNKGKFGKEYDEADDLGAKRKWDKGLGLGREKIFEVRRIYNDVNFIDEFMTPEFIEKHKFYQYGRDPHTGQLRIVSRDPQRIKQTLLYHLTNMGQPFVYVLDGNYANRGELYLAHQHNGPDIDIKYAMESLKSLHKIWHRPVHLQAKIDDE